MVENSCEKKIRFKNLDEIFENQIKNALNSFPEINFSSKSSNSLQSEQESCFILIFKDSDKDSKNLKIFSDEESSYINEFLESEKFDEAESGEIKSIKMKINGIFSHVFCLKLKEKSQDLNHPNFSFEKEKNVKDLFYESCFKKLAIRIKKMQIQNINLVLDEKECKDLILRALNGLVFNNFYFTLKNIENKKTEIKSIKKINIFSDKFTEFNDETHEMKALFESSCLTKIFSAAPANIINPETFSEMVLNYMDGLPNLKIKILSEEEMMKLGMNSLLGVGFGSKSESKLVLLEYMGAPEKDEKIAFVGKGVTFDTGGLSLKPGDYMEGMKYDKSGACSVFGALRTLSKRSAKVNVIGVMVLVENAVSENAQRPDDVIVSMSGQTIDIRNTDAEGRLILADALTYVQRFYKPRLIVDLATLTGAMAVALGSNIYAGLFSNDDVMQKKLRNAGEKTGEKLWRMPLGPEYNKRMDSKIADMQNLSNTKGFGGGSITAAEFLQRFIEKGVSWAHLDIANVDNFASDTESNFYGSCGFGVRLLNEFAKNYE